MHKVFQHMKKKHNSTASSKKRRKSPGTISSTAHGKRTGIEGSGDARNRGASKPISATEAPFTQKNTMFRANPTIKIASMVGESEAFARGFLRIPRVEAVKTTHSCEASFKFHEFNSSPLYSTLVYPTLSQLYSTLLCSTLLNSALLNPTRLNSTLKARANWT